MTKQEFLAELGRRLPGLSREEVEERQSFYREMIDDRMEEGFSEAEAVAQIGSVDAAAADIVGERAPVAVQAEDAPKRKRKAWEIALLILGAPLWGSLLIAAAAVVFSGYVVLWALIVALWAVFVSFAVGGAVAIIDGIVYLAAGDPQGLAILGAGLFCAGCAIFLFFACKAATVGAARLTKKLTLWIKKRCAKKEEA